MTAPSTSCSPPGASAREPGSTIQLRDYQIRAVNDLRAHWRSRPLLHLATGGGKTAVACEIIRCAVAKGRRIVFIAHRRTLVYQARERLRSFGISAGVIMGDEPRTGQAVQVASIQTLARRDLDADIAICDEAHHATSKTWRSVLSRYHIVLGLTATPYRLDGSPLGDVFGHIVHGPSVTELISDGVLVMPRFFAPPGPDLKGVHKRGGEFVQSELEVAVSKPRIFADIRTTWDKHASGLRTIGFAVGIAHSKACAALWGDKGRHIDGETPQEERDQAVADLESGRIHALWNVDLINEGFDLPLLECAILARPTASLALHRQQIGRVMRSSVAKTGALVLDHAGNCARHGLPTDEVEVTLTGKAKRKTEAAPRTCPKCFAVISEWPCWDCGHEPEREEREIRKVEGELVEITGDQRRAWYAEQIDTASRLGYKIGYAKFRFKDRFGVWPRYKDIDETYKCSGHEYERRNYGVICARCLRARGAERDIVGAIAAPS